MADDVEGRPRLARVTADLVDRLAPVRAAGWRALDRRPGVVVDVIRKVNDALGRPLASREELADRRAFARGYRDEREAPATPSAPVTAEAAPVVVYFMDKQRRELERVTELLDSHGIAYKVASLEEDPAAQAAVRRDSGGKRLPLVFVAGTCVGGREELVNLGADGLRSLVHG